MIGEYPHALSNVLTSIEDFNKLSQKAINFLYNSEPDFFFKNKICNAKLFVNKTAKLNYLIAEQNNTLTVYEEPIYAWQDTPFQYTLKGLTQNGKIYSDLVIMTESVGSENTEKQTKTTSSPYSLKNFFNYLYKQQIIKTKFPEEILIFGSVGINKAMQRESDDIKINIQFLTDMCKKHKFTSNKKYEFNDLDNHVWLENGGLCFSSQNVGYYTKQNDNSLTIYAYDKENNRVKKYKTLNSLIKYVESNEDNLIDTVAVKIIDDVVVYSDPLLAYPMSMDILYSKKSMSDKGLGTVQYPIDIQDYDYQLAYYQKNMGITEFSFLTYVFLTSGGGFEYDKENGRFVNSDIGYDKSLINFPKLKEPNKFNSFEYCTPEKRFPYLNEKWTNGLQHLITVLKRDLPIPAVSKTDNKLDDVKKAIIFLENQLNKNIKPKSNKPK